MQASPLADWVRQDIRSQMWMNALALAFWIPAALFMIALTWLMVFVATVFLAPWVGLGEHLVATSIVATLLILALLWWEHRKYERQGGPPVDLIENDFSEGDGELGPQVLNVVLGLLAVLTAASVGRFMFAPRERMVDSIDDAASGRGTVSAPKLITLVLFVVPRAMLDAWKAGRRMLLLPRIDAEAVGAVLEVLMAQEHKITFGALERELRHLENPAQAVAELAFIDGVLFLVAPPRGVYLSTDLRRALTRHLMA